MTVGSVLTAKGTKVTTLTADVSVREAVLLFASQRIGAAPVVVDREVVGVFSERDVIQALQEIGATALDRPISELMTTPAVTVHRDVSVIGALALMTDRRIRHLPVVESGELVGLVSIGDLVKYRIELIEADAAALRDYIQST